MRTRAFAALGAVLSTFGLLSAQAVPCYEPDFGTLVGVGDDMLFPASNLGFAFPYAGTTFTQIRISTNGFVHLGNSGLSSGCCASDHGLFVNGPPRIAVLWTDLVVDSPGGVYLKTLPGSAIVTWHRAVEYGIGTNFTLQLQLVSDGSITMWFHPSAAIVDFYHQCLTGVTPGNGAADPGSIDITASLPFNSNTQPTIYEEWVNPPWFDLTGGLALAFLPNGTNGYVMLNRGCQFAASTAQLVGQGCPALQLPNAEFYELFGAGNMDLANSAIELIPIGPGYLVHQSAAAFVPPTNALVMGDDQVIVQALGFTFTHPGGSITSVGQCSNGYLWLDNGASTSTTYTPSVTELLQLGPRFCPVWVDLYPTTGTVFYDTTPTSALFTWSNVELYASSIDHVTFQVQLHNDGRIIVVYQSMSVIQESIVGYSRGGNVPDPGSIDLSASMPFPTGTGATSLPVRLIPLSSPAIGGTLTLSAIDLPATTLVGLMVLGVTPVSVDLSVLGMPGCTLYETLDAMISFAAASPSANFSMSIPNNPGLVGFAMRAQAALLVPGINPFGFVATNAVAVTVGSY